MTGPVVAALGSPLKPERVEPAMIEKKTCSAGCPGTTGFQRKLFGVIF